MSAELAQQKIYFKQIVETIFNRWTALRLAVEHMGGQHGLQTAIEIVNYVTEVCTANAKADEEYLITLLRDIMDEEFHTECDDNSPEEISHYLWKYLTMLRNGNMQQIEAELSQLPPCEHWIVQGRQIKFVPISDDESSSDEGDNDNAMDDGEIRITDSNSAPSTSGSTMQVEEEDIDPGWTRVGGKGKKKK